MRPCRCIGRCSRTTPACTWPMPGSRPSTSPPTSGTRRSPSGGRRSTSAPTTPASSSTWGARWRTPATRSRRSRRSGRRWTPTLAMPASRTTSAASRSSSASRPTPGLRIPAFSPSPRAAMPPRSPMPSNAWKLCTRLGLTAGVLLSVSPTVRLSSQQRPAYEELQTFSGVLNHVRLNYVDSVTYAQMVRAAIDGVLHALDPHSLFFSRDDWERRNALERGDLAVTGLSFENVDSTITVLSVSPRSPAAHAGVLPGDRLTTVNDTAIAGLDVEKIALRMAGEKGSKVRLQFERGPRLEPDTFTVTVKRDYLHPLSVSIVRMADSATGYVRLDEFGPTAAEEVHRGLKDLKGKGMRRLI